MAEPGSNAGDFRRPFPALTAEQRLHLEIYGYVVVPGTLSSEEAGRILEALQRLKRELHSARDRSGDPSVRVRGANLLKDEPHHVYMGAIVETDPAIAGYAIHPRLVGMAEELMGSEARIVEVNAHINRRDPDADLSAPATFGFHRGTDVPFGTHRDGGLFHCNFVKTLTNLTELGPDDGGTTVIAGSHKLAQPPEELIACAYRDRSLIHQVVAPAGSTLLFGETLIHATGQVRSDRERAIVICGYAPTMYQSWEDGELSDAFVADLPECYRPLFLGRRHWLRGARRRSLADPAEEGTFALPEWPAPGGSRHLTGNRQGAAAERIDGL